MSIDFTPGIINIYNGDIYNCTINTDKIFNDVKAPETSKRPYDNSEKQLINFSFPSEENHPEQLYFAQKQSQQINECHTIPPFTDAEYSRVVDQLVNIINNIESIDSKPLTQQTQTIFNQINKIIYQEDKDSECQIIVVVNPTPNRPITTRILIEEEIPKTFSIQTVCSDNNIFAGQRADLPSEIKDIQSLYLKLAKLYVAHSENENRMNVFSGCDFINFNMTGQDMSGLVLTLSKFYYEDLLNIDFTDANLLNTIFLHKKHPIPKLHNYDQHLDKQIDGLFSTLLTINDESLRAKSEIASTIIQLLKTKVKNLTFKDILKYQQEFQKECYEQLQIVTTDHLYNKIKKWATMSKDEFNAFKYRTLQLEKISHSPYLKMPLPNEKDINYGVEIKLPTGKRIRLSTHYQNIIP
ncbi:TPA: hypothetical protein OB695_001027 [Escherichia coli]|nr:hypothetical protein [Escherichia coli]